MASYNIKSAIDNGWNPQSFGCTRFGSDLLEKIAEFQKQNGLEADGFCGPNTLKKLREQEKKYNHIVCGLKHIKVPWRVVLWYEKKGLKAKNGSYRKLYSERDVKLFVNHWDVVAGKGAKDTIKILNKRNLSSQFLIDKDGVIYQTVNAQHICFHAGSRLWNNLSVGVEINNPYYLKYQDKDNPRPIVENAFVHGKKMSKHLDFYPIQTKALMHLWKAINKAYQIPFQTPTRKAAYGKMVDLGTVHEPSQLGDYSGFIHHYNLTAGKIDCGGYELSDIIRKIKKSI